MRLQHIGDARIEVQESEAAPELAPAALKQRPWWQLATSVVVTSALTAAAAWWLVDSTALAPELIERFVIALPDDTELYLADDFYGRGSLAISPDRRHIAYIAQHNGTTQLYLRPMDRTEPIAVGPEGATMPFFSADGQWLAYFEGGALRKVSVLGGAPVPISNFLDVKGASWGDDGTIVVGTLGNNDVGLIKVAADEGTPETLTIPNRETGENPQVPAHTSRK
jgi:hypothetical protein